MEVKMQDIPVNLTLYSIHIGRTVFFTQEPGTSAYECSVCKRVVYSKRHTATCQHIDCVKVHKERSKRVINAKARAKAKAIREGNITPEQKVSTCPYCKKKYNVLYPGKQASCLSEECRKAHDKMRRRKNHAMLRGRQKTEKELSKHIKTRVEAALQTNTDKLNSYQFELDFYAELTTHVPEFPNWDCAENDPLTNRTQHEGVWVKRGRLLMPRKNQEFFEKTA